MSKIVSNNNSKCFVRLKSKPKADVQIYRVLNIYNRKQNIFGWFERLRKELKYLEIFFFALIFFSSEYEKKVKSGVIKTSSSLFDQFINVLMRLKWCFPLKLKNSSNPKCLFALVRKKIQKKDTKLCGEQSTQCEIL